MLTRLLNRLLQSVIITSTIYLTMSISHASMQQSVNHSLQLEPPQQEAIKPLLQWLI